MQRIKRRLLITCFAMITKPKKGTPSEYNLRNKVLTTSQPNPLVWSPKCSLLTDTHTVLMSQPDLETLLHRCHENPGTRSDPDYDLRKKNTLIAIVIDRTHFPLFVGDKDFEGLIFFGESESHNE